MEQFFDQTFKPGISDFLNFLIAVLMGSSLGHEAPQLGALRKNAEVPKPSSELFEEANAVLKVSTIFQGGWEYVGVFFVCCLYLSFQKHDSCESV